MSPRIQAILGQIRVFLVRGALFVVPILFALWLCWFVLTFVYGICESLLGGLTAQVVRWILPDAWLTGIFADGHIPGLSLLVALGFLTALGALLSWHFGRQGLSVIDYLLSKVPVVRTIYSAARKVSEAIGEPGQSRFQKVVLIDWPGPGIKTLGFVTNEVSCAVSAQKHYFVFVPTMPNPTSGFVVVVRADACIETGMRPEEGLKLAISLGVMAPEKLSLVPGRDA